MANPLDKFIARGSIFCKTNEAFLGLNFKLTLRKKKCAVYCQKSFDSKIFIAKGIVEKCHWPLQDNLRQINLCCKWVGKS